MALDRLLGDEQRLGDLPIRLPFGGLPADPPLRRRERVRPGQLRPCRSPRPGLELGPRRSSQRSRPALICELDGTARRGSSLPALAGTTPQGREVAERMGKLELGGTRLKDRHRLLEERESLGVADHARRGAQREAQCSGCPHRPRHRQLLARQRQRLLVLAERSDRRCGVRTPFARPLHALRAQPLAAPQEVRDPLA